MCLLDYAMVTGLRQIHRRWALAWLCLTLTLPILAACGRSAERPPLNVVATIAPLADWARQVGQERVVVTQLVPINTDPHEYALTDRDRQALAQADVILFNGLNLEPWLAPALKEINPPQAIIFELAQIADFGSSPISRPSQSRALLPDEDQPAQRPAGSREPRPAPQIRSAYLWLDPGPNMAQRGVALIADMFGRADEDRLLFYRRNAERYNGELDELDFWIKQQVRAWPRVTAGKQELLAMQSVDTSWDFFVRRYSIILRTTANLKSYNPPLPDSTPLFVDQFVPQAEQYQALGLRKPDGVLNPLSTENYVQLVRANVELMTAGFKQAAARRAPNRSQQPDRLLTMP